MANALDGTLTTYANCRYQPVTVIMNLGQSYNVTGLRLLNYSNSSYTPSVKIEYSTDGATYTEIGTPTNSEYLQVADASTRYYQYMGFYSPVTCGYLRLTLTYPSSNNYNRLYELDIYNQ